jgi:hypothetical protein
MQCEKRWLILKILRFGPKTLEKIKIKEENFGSSTNDNFQNQKLNRQ